MALRACIEALKAFNVRSYRNSNGAIACLKPAEATFVGETNISFTRPKQYMRLWNIYHRDATSCHANINAALSTRGCLFKRATKQYKDQSTQTLVAKNARATRCESRTRRYWNKVFLKMKPTTTSCAPVASIFVVVVVAVFVLVLVFVLERLEREILRETTHNKCLERKCFFI